MYVNWNKTTPALKKPGIARFFGDCLGPGIDRVITDRWIWSPRRKPHFIGFSPLTPVVLNYDGDFLRSGDVIAANQWWNISMGVEQQLYFPELKRGSEAATRDGSKLYHGYRPVSVLANVCRSVCFGSHQFFFIQ